MQSSSTTWIEIGVSAVGLIGLLVLLAPALGRGPKRLEDGWLFPVKLTCLLARWIGLVLGVGAVAYAGHTLLASTIANWGAWASFAFGFVLVPLVLSHWPEPVVFDRAGLWKRGNPMSRIRWEELAYVRQYDIRNDRGIVIHSVYGKQLVVDENLLRFSPVVGQVDGAPSRSSPYERRRPCPVDPENPASPRAGSSTVGARECGQRNSCFLPPPKAGIKQLVGKRKTLNVFRGALRAPFSITHLTIQTAARGRPSVGECSRFKQIRRAVPTRAPALPTRCSASPAARADLRATGLAGAFPPR